MIHRKIVYLFLLVCLFLIVLACVLLSKSMRVETIEIEVSEISETSEVSEDTSTYVEEYVKPYFRLLEYHGHSNQFETVVISEYEEIAEEIHVVRGPLSIVEVNEQFTHYKEYYDYKYECYIAIPMSETWQKFTYNCCLKYNIPYELALAIMGTESGFNVFIGKLYGGEKDPHYYYGPGMVSVDAAENGLRKVGIELCTYEGGIEAVCYILKEKLEEFDWDFHKALMAYNAGSGGAEYWIKQGITETAYSNRVLEIMRGIKGE